MCASHNDPFSTFKAERFFAVQAFTLLSILAARQPATKSIFSVAMMEKEAS